MYLVFKPDHLCSYLASQKFKNVFWDVITWLELDWLLKKPSHWSALYTEGDSKGKKNWKLKKLVALIWLRVTIHGLWLPLFIFLSINLFLLDTNSFLFSLIRMLSHFLFIPLMLILWVFLPLRLSLSLSHSFCHSFYASPSLKRPFVLSLSLARSLTLSLSL